MPSEDAPLLMFFYGTLKRNERNHDAYCGGALGVSNASVRGRLYALPAGYPAMIVPEQTVRAAGTADPARDAAVGRRRTDQAPAFCGPLVSGELHAFDDPEERLPALDLLEGFAPCDPVSEYRRVLVPASTPDGGTRFAWTYVVDTPVGRRLPAGRWPG